MTLLRRSLPLSILAMLLIAALMAVPLACLAALTAPLHSPGFAAELLCPPGSQPETEWYRATYNEPGERTLTVLCVDTLGNRVPANPSDASTLVKGIRLYFPVVFLPVFIIGAFALVVMNLLLAALRRTTANTGQ